ncbi:MAG: bacteriohemerythrin [Acidihalobacter sp.]|jgi:hemerythrin
MAYLDWKDELNTGIGVIDRQHRRIVDYINQLHEITQGDSDTSTVDVLTALVDYTLSHFAFEESLLEEAGYPQHASHVRTHDAFRNRIFDFRERARQGEDVAAPLLELLRDWLFDHIAHEDARYVPVVSTQMSRLEHREQGGWMRDQLKRWFGQRH